MHILRLLSVSIPTFFFFISTTLFAATFNVNSTQDAVDANPGNGVCATAAGECTLRAAIQEANTDAAADTIELPAGIYELNLFGLSEEDAATGDLDIKSPLTINGADKDTTIIDGLFADRIFNIKEPFPFFLSNLTIRNGNEPGAGGAIYNEREQRITATEVLFINNYADTGGVIFTAGPATITDCMFRNNAANSASEMYITYGNSSPVSVTGTSFMNGSSLSLGVVFISNNNGPVTISNSEVIDNTSQSSGIVYVSNGSGDLDITGSEFTGNTSNGLGALYYSGDGDVTVTNSKFIANTCVSGVGGAMYISAGGAASLEVTDVGFQENQADGGADIYFSTGTGTVGLTRVTSTDSFCPGGGPGCSMYISGGGSNVLLDMVSIDGAFASTGSAGILEVSGYDNVEISRSSFTNGSLFSGTSAGVYVSIGNDLLIEDSTIAGNILFSSGTVAGLFASYGGAATIRRSSFYDNRATAAGSTVAGLFLSGPSALIENTTFSNNDGHENGALFISSPTMIYNSTFYDNTASVNASSIFKSGNLGLTNTIIGGESPVDHCAGGGPTISGGFNIESTDTCGVGEPSDMPNTNPSLSELQTTPESALMVHVPLIGSPAIEGGENASCLADDQRQVARPFDGDQAGTAICDIGAVEFNDFCPEDDTKQFEGVCGCGVPDSDSDGDGTLDCNDGCPADSGKTSAGVCGCGTADTDSDGDGTADCNDSCPADRTKVIPGACGCSIADADLAFQANGIADCLEGQEIQAAAGSLLSEVEKIRKIGKRTKKKKRREIIAARNAARTLLNELTSFVTSSTTVSVATPGQTLDKLTKRLTKRVRKVFKLKRANKKKRRRAIAAIQALADGIS